MHRAFFFLCFSFILPCAIAQDKHIIVYLISPPRSLSVACTKIFEARGDFAILHEPSVHPNATIYFPEETEGWFIGNLKTFDDAKNEIIKISKQSSLFVKEISFSCVRFLKNCPELLSHSNAYFIFLVRDPHATIISFYKKFPQYQQEFSRLIGYKNSFEIYQMVTVNGANKPLIITSEELAQEPERIYKEICAHIGINYMPESLQWIDIDASSAGNKWKDQKTQEAIEHWHGDALHSNQFHKPTSYEVDIDGKPTFSEIIDEQAKQMCKRAYEENLVYYQLLLTEKNK